MTTLYEFCATFPNGKCVYVFVVTDSVQSATAFANKKAVAEGLGYSFTGIDIVASQPLYLFRGVFEFIDNR